MDFVYTTHFPVTTVHVDCFGRCKPSSFLRFTQDAAEEHCLLLGTDWDSMASKRYFWAVIRQRIQITQYPKAGEIVTVKTWPMPTTRVAYPRAAEGFNEAGESLFKVISLWVIVDMDTRAMVLPGKSGVDVAGTVLGTELKAPGGLPAGAFTNSVFRTVSYSDLDVNGHMNNTQYLNWVDDLLIGAYHRDHPAREFTICYLSEALEGQTLELHWTLDDGLRVDAQCRDEEDPAKTRRIFAAKVVY